MSDYSFSSKFIFEFDFKIPLFICCRTSKISIFAGEEGKALREGKNVRKRNEIEVRE